MTTNLLRIPGVIPNMSADPDVPWDLISKVRRSTRKTEIVVRLHGEPASASELSEVMDIQRDTISNYLRDLKQMNPPLVMCLTPNQPHHRLYGLTDEGQLVHEHL